MKKILNNKKGYALAFVLLLISFISILGVTVSSILATENNLLVTREDNVSATYAAQAGLDHMCALLAENYDSWPAVQTVVLHSEGNESIYYTIRRLSRSIVQSDGYIQNNGSVSQTVRIIAYVDQMNNVIIY